MSSTENIALAKPRGQMGYGYDAYGGGGGGDDNFHVAFESRKV